MFLKEERKMTKQKWVCGRCKKEGEVTFKKGTDVMSVVHKIGDNHRRVSPRCEQPVGMLRVPK